MKGFLFAIVLGTVAGEVYAGCPGGVCPLKSRVFNNAIVDRMFHGLPAETKSVQIVEPTAELAYVTSEPLVVEAPVRTENWCRPTTDGKCCRRRFRR